LGAGRYDHCLWVR